MPVTGDRSLRWEAEIATKKLEAGTQRIIKNVEEMRRKNGQEFSQMQKSVLGLEIKMESYRRIAQKTLDPNVLREYNREIQKLEKQIQQLKNAGKEGFDNMGNAIDKTSGFVNKLKANVGQLAAAFGLAFGLAQVVQWGKELTQLAIKASGVERAFSRLGGSEYLAKLRTETKGLVSDLELQRLANEAAALNIPLKDLGLFLAFASKTAQETGKSVDYLTQSIIDGLGRESKLKIDNLGISQVELNKAIQQTGNFTDAVASIIRKRMGEAGSDIDTLADKANRTSSVFANLAKDIGSFFARAFNPDLADDSKIGNLTDKLTKRLENFSKLSADAQGKIIDAQLKKIEELDKKYLSIKNDPNFGKYVPGLKGPGSNNITLRAAAEELAANQNLLKTLQDQNKERLKAERLAKGIISLNELTAKQQSLQDKAFEELDPVKRAAYLKEAEDIQKQIDDILGKGLESRLKKEESAYERSLRLQKNLLEQISKLNDDYSRQGLTKEEQERQAIRDRFKLLKSEIAEFNKTAAKGLVIDTGQMDLIQANLMDELMQRQFVELQKVTIAEQKQLFEQFEAYKLEYGVAKARERFAGELAGFKTYIDYLKSLMPDEGDTSAGANALRDYLNKAIPEAQLNADKKSFDDAIKNLKRVLEATKSAKDEELKIEEKYLQDLALLRQEFANNPEELARRAKRLKEIKDQAVQAAYDEEIHRTEVYKEATERIVNFTKAAAKEQISKIDEVLKFEKLSEKEREELLKKRLELQEAIVKLDLETSGAILGQLSGSLREAAGLMGKFNAEAAKTINTVAELAEGVGGIFAGIATGNPFAIISGTIAAASAIYDLVDKSAEKRAANEEKQRYNMERTQAAIEGINRLLEYQAKIIDRALGTDRIEAFNRQIRAINSDLLSVIQKINNVDLSRIVDERGRRKIIEFQATLKTLNDTLGRPTRPGSTGGALSTIDAVIEENRGAIESLYKLMEAGQLTGNVDELKDLLKTYEQLEQQLEEYRNKLKQVITGTTLVSIVDSLADGFKQGFRSAEEFASNFEDLMKNAVIQSLKMQALEKPLQEFYDQLAVDSESGGSLDSDEIAKLKELYEGIITNAGKRFEELQQIAGLDFSTGTDQKQGALAGAIRGITADHADILAGQFNGQRMATLEGVQIGRQSLDVLHNSFRQQQLIERNTYNTVQSLATTNQILTAQLTEANKQLAVSNQRLGSIDRKTDSAGDIGRSLGM